MKPDVPSLKQDVLPLLLIFAAGLLAAWVCFGLLNSQAHAGVGYSVGGAFAGALISWGALGSLFLQLRRSSDVYSRMQREIRELQQKLIRGAPRPPNFDTEVDERQQLVLARPEDWQRGGGLVFEFQGPYDRESRDIFPAHLRVYAEPLEPDLVASERSTSWHDFYRKYYSSLAPTLFAGPWSSELVEIGADMGGVPSLRFTGRAYARITISTEPGRQDPSLVFQYVGREEFVNHVGSCVERVMHQLEPRRTTASPPGSVPQMRRIAERKAILKDAFVGALESGEVDPRDSVEAMIREEVIRRRLLGSEQESEPENEGSDPQKSPGAGGNPDAAEAVTAESKSADGQTPDKEASPGTVEASQRIEVLPVDRIFLVCANREARRTYFFDFADNTTDFVESSDVFNKILRSVRFLN